MGSWSTTQNESFHSTKLSIKETLVIESGDGTAADKPIIGFADHVMADREGNIYVYDGRDGRNFVYKYDQEGNFLNKIGREGKGPGEHLQITAMLSDSKNRLITADRENARITVFNNNGQEVNTIPLPEVGKVSQIREMPNGNFILAGWSQRQEKLLHIINNDFSKFEQSIVSLEKVASYYEGFTEKQWLQNLAGFAEAKSTDQIIFVPAYYNGVLYQFQKENVQYSLANKIEGYNKIDPPLTFHSRSDSPSRINGMINTSEGGYMMIKNFSTSFGIFKLKDDTFIHLSFLFSDKTTKLVIEHFSESMDLLQYLVTDELNLGMTNRKEPLWVDQNGQIYLTDNAEIPKVRRIQITGLGLD